MGTLLQIPEAPIGEVWEWQTDVIVATDGTEQRIDLCELPKRNFKFTYTFDTEADIRREAALMLKFGAQFDGPLFQYQTRLTADAASGAVSLALNVRRTDLRAGGKAYVFDDDGGEVVTIDALTSSTATLHAGLSRAYSKRAAVCPVVTLYSAGTASLSRLNTDLGATGDFTLRELGFNVPFVQSWNDTALTTFNGLPVLQFRPIGTNFDQSADTGATVTDFGGNIDIRNPWTHAKEVFARTYLCNRELAPLDWDLWRVFGDYTKGSCNPFYVPTFRSDFDIVSLAVDRLHITLAGTSYLNDYFPYATYKQIAITTSAGVHYATVSAAIATGGNTFVTFSPALPTGEAWDIDRSLSLLLLCRIADDKVSCNHFPLHSEIQLNLRTVDG